MFIYNYKLLIRLLLLRTVYSTCEDSHVTEQKYYYEVQHDITNLLAQIYLVLYIVEAHRHTNMEYVHNHLLRKYSH